MSVSEAVDMKLTDIVRGIGRKLADMFPGCRMYVDKISAGAEGCFLLNIVQQTGNNGISGRRIRSVQFDLLYFQREDERLVFMDWADRLQEAFSEIDCGGQIVYTTDRSARREDMIFHFLFNVGTVFSEYSDEGIPAMEELEVNVE